MKIDVAFLPSDINKAGLGDKVCIVLDIFRATTSIVTAMQNGCQRIVPVASLEAAVAKAETLGTVLMAGERQSIKLPGFDFGNSPFEFSGSQVKGQTIVMTTTNGTVAIKGTEGAYCTLIGAFINGEAVYRQAQAYNKDILIVCAGTDRAFSLEDSLCAGFLTGIFSQNAIVTLSDTALAAYLMYQSAAGSLQEIAIVSRNGQRLVELGRENEVAYCLSCNLVAAVPEYHDEEIRLPASWN